MLSKTIKKRFCIHQEKEVKGCFDDFYPLLWQG
jgi:hypothetical protein